VNSVLRRLLGTEVTEDFSLVADPSRAGVSFSLQRKVPLLGYDAAEGSHNGLKSILTNEAGMFFDIRYFHFWNTGKAGMFMKTRALITKSRNVIDK